MSCTVPVVSIQSSIVRINHLIRSFLAASAVLLLANPQSATGQELQISMRIEDSLDLLHDNQDDEATREIISTIDYCRLVQEHDPAIQAVLIDEAIPLLSQVARRTSKAKLYVDRYKSSLKDKMFTAKSCCSTYSTIAQAICLNSHVDSSGENVALFQALVAAHPECHSHLVFMFLPVLWTSDERRSALTNFEIERFFSSSLNMLDTVQQAGVFRRDAERVLCIVFLQLIAIKSRVDIEGLPHFTHKIRDTLRSHKISFESLESGLDQARRGELVSFSENAQLDLLERLAVIERLLQ